MKHDLEVSGNEVEEAIECFCTEPTITTGDMGWP